MLKLERHTVVTSLRRILNVRTPQIYGFRLNFVFLGFNVTTNVEIMRFGIVKSWLQEDFMPAGCVCVCFMALLLLQEIHRLRFVI